MGNNCTNFAELVTFLKSVDANTLFENTKTPIAIVENGRKLIDLAYRPVVEDESSQNPFFTERPEDLMKSKGIDMMIGYTTQVSFHKYTRETYILFSNLYSIRSKLQCFQKLRILH